jgi:GFO/IDH/MocA C-terminal domain/Oxidoreductase family, NAD-binding Rossmann fold
LVTIVDPAPGALEVAAKAGVPLLASLPDLLAKQTLDGVIIATPNRLHVEQGLACIAAGVPALIEKPLSDTIDSGERLCQAAESARVKLLTGHHRQHNAIMSRAVEVVKSGRLGRLVAVVGTEMFCKPDQYFEDGPWRRQPGGGPLLINMVHEIGNLRALCGEIVAVQAFASSATRNFPVEDTVSISLRFANGVLGSFMLSDTVAAPRSWEQTTREDPVFAAYPDEDCYIVAGTDGSLAIPTMLLRFYGDPDSGLGMYLSKARSLRSITPILWRASSTISARLFAARRSLGSVRAMDCKTCASSRLSVERRPAGRLVLLEIESEIRRFRSRQATQSGFLPWRRDHAVEPCNECIQYVSKHLRILPACPRRHMKRMIGIRKQL